MPKLALSVFLVAAAALDFVWAGGHGHGGHHVIIHVPYKIHKIHHTHTITKHIHHKDEGGDKYEVLGYTVGHPIDLGGHGGGHGGGHDFGGGGHDFGGGGHDFGGGGHDFGGHDFGGSSHDFGGGGGGGGHDFGSGGHDLGGGGGGGGGHVQWSGPIKAYEGSFDGGHGGGGYETVEHSSHEFSGGHH